MKKRLLSLILAAALISALAGCGALVDYNTPKSGELSTQYDFYSDSQRELASGMAITPEQADEVFLVLVSCGMDGKVSSVTRKAGDEGHCTVSALGTIGSFDVYYTDGVVDRVEKGGKELYPEMYNILMDCKVKVADVKNGFGTDVIGQRAYIDILKSQLVTVSADDYKEFVETVVKDSGYNWFSIMCEDGTGITFPGSMYFVGEYGKQDKDGSISEKYGTISIQEDETYLYEEN